MTIPKNNYVKVHILRHLTKVGCWSVSQCLFQVIFNTQCMQHSTSAPFSYLKRRTKYDGQTVSRISHIFSELSTKCWTSFQLFDGWMLKIPAFLNLKMELSITDGKKKLWQHHWHHVDTKLTACSFFEASHTSSRGRMVRQMHRCNQPSHLKMNSATKFRFPLRSFTMRSR